MLLGDPEQVDPSGAGSSFFANRQACTESWVVRLERGETCLRHEVLSHGLIKSGRPQPNNATFSSVISTVLNPIRWVISYNPISMSSIEASKYQSSIWLQNHGFSLERRPMASGTCA